MKTIKKWFAFCLAMLMAFSVMTVCASASGPGSTTTTAMQVTLGRTYTGTIGSGQTRYFYKYTLPSSGRLIISVKSSNIYRMMIDTYDVDNTRVFYNDVYQNSISGVIDFYGTGELIGGTYYLCIERKGYDGNFTFSVDVDLAGDSFPETFDRRDNTTLTANSIVLGKQYAGHIAYNDNDDFFKVYVSNPCTLPLNIESLDMTFMRVYVYDENLNRISLLNPTANNASGVIKYSNSIGFSKTGYYYLDFNKYYEYSGHEGAYTFSLGETTPKTYTVTFNGNGGSVSTGSKTVNAGTAITLPSATRSGHTFLGWSENSSATSPTYNAGASYTVNKNVTLYAVWSGGIIPPTERTVTFNGNGGTVSTAFHSAPAGSTITLPSATRSGYTFLGWSESSSASSPSYPSGALYTVTRDVTLYAVWQQIQPNPNPVNVLQRIFDVMIGIINFFLKLFGAMGVTL